MIVHPGKIYPLIFKDIDLRHSLRSVNIFMILDEMKGQYYLGVNNNTHEGINYYLKVFGST